MTASQGLAGAPSYIPNSFPERECVHSEAAEALNPGSVEAMLQSGKFEEEMAVEGCQGKIWKIYLTVWKIYTGDQSLLKFAWKCGQ